MSIKEGLFGSGCHVIFSNVADVLRGAPEEKVKNVNTRYAQRQGHAPHDRDSEVYVLGGDSEIASRQTDYISRMTGQRIQAISHEKLKGLDAVVVPYIRVTETDTYLATCGIASERIWGLHPGVTNQLKNKAIAKGLFSELGISTPEFRIVNIHTLTQAGHAMLKEIEFEYANVGINNYPLGVFIKHAECDGGYGAFAIRTEGKSFVCIPDGDSKLSYVVGNVGLALELAYKHISKSINRKRPDNMNVVIERMVDHIESPALTFAFIRGNIYCIGAVGQVTRPGGLACIGTSRYESKNEFAREVLENNMSAMTSAFHQLLRESATRAGVHLHELTGVSGMDLLIPGPREVEYRKRKGLPISPLVVEINPRWTNSTDGQAQALRILNTAVSPESLRWLLNHGFLTVDKVYMPGYSHQDQINIAGELDRHWSQFDTRVVLRMHDPEEPGFLFFGPYALKAHENLISSYGV